MNYINLPNITQINWLRVLFIYILLYVILQKLSHDVVKRILTHVNKDERFKENNDKHEEYSVRNTTIKLIRPHYPTWWSVYATHTGWSAHSLRVVSLRTCVALWLHDYACIFWDYLCMWDPFILIWGIVVL